MKKYLISVFFVLISSFSSFAQMQFYNVEEKPYFSFNVANHLDFFNIDKTMCPLSFNSDAVFVSKYFKAQGGFAFHKNQADLILNLQGQYKLPIGITVGGIVLSNVKFYYDLAREFDVGALVFADYFTPGENYWKFSTELGIGSIITQIQYKKHGETHWTEKEYTFSYLVDFTILKKIASKHIVWGEILTFQNYRYNYGLCPNISFGYGYDLDKNWGISGSLDLNYLTLLTNIGRLKDFGITLRVSYRLPLKTRGEK